MYYNGVVLNANSYSALFSSANSTSVLSVPVSPNSVIYSQFDYIHGVPAASDQDGIPINRIHILDMLIGQLQKMNKPVETSGPITEMTEKQQDALIKQFQENIRNTLKATYNNSFYGYAGLLPESGAVFSILA